MTRLKWNDFVGKYPKTVAYGTILPTLPNSAPSYDLNQKKTPTPYKLLTTWLEQNISKDWAIDRHPKNKNVVYIMFADQTDQAAFRKRFPTDSQANPSPVSPKTYSFDFDPKDYKDLALLFGYVF